MNIGNVVDKITEAHARFTDYETDGMVFHTGANYVAFGACMTCLVFDEFVVKWVTRNNKPFHESAGKDIELLASVSPDDIQHFPETIMERGFIIQERITPLKNHDHIDDVESFLGTIIRLGMTYNIKDLHAANVGFRDGDQFTPVIFDMSGWHDYSKNRSPDLAREIALNRERLNLPFFFLEELGYCTTELRQLAFNMIRHYM